MKKIFMLLTVLVILYVVPVSANATIITFSDKAQFLASTDSTSATGPLPNINFTYGWSQTIGNATFSVPSTSELYIGGGTLDWTLLHPGNDIAISGPEDLNVDLASPVLALGFDFVEPKNTPCYANICYDSTFTVTLKNGTNTVDSFMFNAPDDVLAFVGVWTDTPFTMVEIRDTSATIDDEFFGEFYTGTTHASVPEP
ncbi:MAG TPA: hypothetical protein DDX84_04430, partial [Nitrospiraceae bacterium]|nr:hypothetical protein [Nitrospiraceae bacterium]